MFSSNSRTPQVARQFFKYLQKHSEYRKPIPSNRKHFVRAKRVSNCYMQEKKTDRVCVCVDVRLIFVLVCTYVCFLVLMWKNCLGFSVGYQRAPGTRELDRLLQLHQTELRPHLPRARPSLVPRDAQLQAWGGTPEAAASLLLPVSL